MTAPNMATITESLERSLQNCSLNHERRSTHNIGGGSGGGDGGGGEERSIRRSSSYTSDDDNNNNNNDNLQITGSDTSLELNSHLSLPYHLEQCLDLKTGEIYYINWMNGMKAREDPRTTTEYNGDFYSDEDDDDDDDEDDDSLYDSEESQSETSHCSTRERKEAGERNNNNNSNNNNNNKHHRVEKDKDNVLVVAGCKSCFMYFMVPKQVEDCPKCNGQILHFDRSETSSPSSLLH